jgi:drug/metabolite transporter (DMT)-like permease
MSPRKTHLDSTAITILLACCLFWGLQQVLVKATIPEVPPVLQAFLRFAGATVILWAWCRRRGIALFVRDESWWPGLVAGALFSAEFACLFIGLNYTSASRLTVFVYTSPLWVAALLPLLVKAERLRPSQWLGVTCAFVAVVFALREGLHGDTTTGKSLVWLGDSLALAAGMLWGLTTVVIRSTALARISAERLLFYQVAISALTLPFVSLALNEAWTFQYSAFAWTSLAVQTVVGAFASYLAWMWLLGRYPATRVSVFVFLTPMFALLFGALWLKETVTATLVLALGFVALGIVLVSRRAA